VTDGAAAADWYAGLATAGFTTGPHQVDTSALASSFVGGLSAGNYSSNNPVTTRVPASAILRIALMPAAPPIDLPINGVHIQWHFSGTTGIASGEIQGSVRQDDVNNYFIPSFAAILNDQIQADTSSATAHAIESLFDKGGCAGATASDGVINVCELATSSLIQTLLAPDVHIYDGVGNYAPAPTGTANALSIGLGFTAVPTSF
jgi:hypothetical protein